MINITFTGSAHEVLNDMRLFVDRKDTGVKTADTKVVEADKVVEAEEVKKPRKRTKKVEEDKPIASPEPVNEDEKLNADQCAEARALSAKFIQKDKEHNKAKLVEFLKAHNVNRVTDLRRADYAAFVELVGD